MTHCKKESQIDREVRLFNELRKARVSHLLRLLYDPDRDVRRSASTILHLKGGRSAYSRAKELCASEKASLRETGAFVLAQLGTPKFPFARQSEPVLARMALSDPSANVRAEAVTGLGHLARRASYKTLLKSACDRSPKVRESVAFALKAHGKKAIRPLLQLTYDTNEDVRSWATFSLNYLNIGFPRVRNRFAELLKDDSEEIRGEAINALARWKDSRVFPVLKRELNKRKIAYDCIKAAGYLGDRRLLPRLCKLADEWGDSSPRVLIDAVKRLSK